MMTCRLFNISQHDAHAVSARLGTLQLVPEDVQVLTRAQTFSTPSRVSSHPAKFLLPAVMVFVFRATVGNCYFFDYEVVYLF